MKIKSPYFWPTVFLFFLLFLFSFGNQIVYRYAVPPGGDVMGHNNIVLRLLNGDYSLIFSYHTAWHIVVAGLSLIFKIKTLTVMAWLAPGLLITMGLSVFLFSQRFFGITAAFASVILLGFFSNQPLQTLYDGSFPNVLAAGTVLPLVFILLDRLFTAKKRWFAIFFFGLSLVFLAFSHHLTTLYAIPIIGLFFLAQLWITKRKRGVSRLKIITAALLCLGIGLIAIVLFVNSSIGGSTNELAKQFMRVDSVFPFFHLLWKLDNPNAIWPIAVYPNGIGEAIVYLGLGGFVCATWHAWKHAYSGEGRMSLLLVLWVGILFIASRIEAIGFPVRLARDLAIPLGILSGFFIQSTIEYIQKRRVPFVFVYIFIGLCIATGIVTSWNRYRRMVAPNPLIYHLPVDTQAADYITSNLKLTDRILTFQDAIYLRNFAPLHDIYYVEVPSYVKRLVNPPDALDLLGNTNYIYLEFRRDREESWLNNEGIIAAYKSVPYTELTAQFEQPEKIVYLFKINTNTIPKPTPTPSPSIPL